MSKIKRYMEETYGDQWTDRIQAGDVDLPCESTGKLPEGEF